ncbi:MAG TPA: hypothetical protein ENL27_01355 [Candidatus Parcubacteria bacterium]|nr:hypothetical protein [Candidatus Parcubacteria bacterium]
MKKEIYIACATDDGENFSKEHFGSADFYLIYSLNLKNGKLKFVSRRENKSIKEKAHGDPEKAKSVAKLFKDVQILMAKVMGPNILIIRKKFIPVISNEESISKAINRLKKKIDLIKKNLEKPTGLIREIIYINK